MKINEIYSKDNAKIYNHFKNDVAFNPYDYAYYIVDWLEFYYHGSISRMNYDLHLNFKYNNFHEMREALDTHNSEHFLEIFEHLPENLKEKCKEFCKDKHKDEEVESVHPNFFVELNNKIPRSSWLIHFTDKPLEVWRHGFKQGIKDLSKIGISVYAHNKTEITPEQGYNFAFIANSPEVNWAARSGNYGEHALMFQSSGIKVYSWKDHETQIIFSGNSINPRDIILLYFIEQTWCIVSRKNKNILYHDENISKVVSWVENNHQQYRGVL